MGITGEIVRSVFLKSRPRDDTQGSCNNVVVEKRKWSSSVRSYLCGDEHNSLVAADDSTSFGRSVDEASFTSNRATNTSTLSGDITSNNIYAVDTASVRSSEATVTQPRAENEMEKLNSAYELFRREDAAFTIQSAFRTFQARRARVRQETGEEEKQEHTQAVSSPSRESISTSVEAQTGDSSGVFSINDVPRKLRHRSRAQVLRIQEDWDDSTVSSVISKMRMQNRAEAATRRERALAYAFSQQLRICSKKKLSCSVTGDETNVGWSWLERWMATRQIPEDSIRQKTLVRKRMLDHVAMEERESCGSNEVPSVIEITPKNVPRPPKNRVKISRQNSTSSHLCPRDHHSEDVKKVWHMEDEIREKRKKQKQPGNKREGHMEDEIREKRKKQKQPGNKREGMKNASTTHQVQLQLV